MVTSPISFSLVNSPLGIDRHLLPSTSSTPPRGGDVARRRIVAERSGLHAVGGQPLLRIDEVDLLGQDAGAIHLRDQRRLTSLRPVASSAFSIVSVNSSSSR